MSKNFAVLLAFLASVFVLATCGKYHFKNNQTQANDAFTGPFKAAANRSLHNFEKNSSGNFSFELNNAQTVYSVMITGKADLPLATSLVRVILVDNTGHEYLVYEAYPLLNTSKGIEFENVCDETCALEGIQATRVKVQVENATFDLKTVDWATSIDQLRSDIVARGIAVYAAELKTKQDISKTEWLNANIKTNGLRWTADVTSIAALLYDQKKQLFKNLEFVPAMQGFEFYRAGIFDLAPGAPVPPGLPQQKFGDNTPEENHSAGASLPKAWDWRHAHGENWITPVRNQASCGSCWAFGALGSVEGIINLYFNQHLDIDLAEQSLVSCANLGGCSGGMPDQAMKYVLNKGIPDEACFPYRASGVSCSGKCSNAESRSWKVTKSGVPALDDTTFKTTIFQKGPFGFGIYSWSHEMLAVGYTNETDTSQTAATRWHIKNSWGTGWGQQGFTTMTVSQSDRGWDVFAEQPFFAADPNKFQISCVDKDTDNYCNWGLSSTKPDSCPESCLAEKDCDDSDDEIGMCK